DTIPFITDSLVFLPLPVNAEKLTHPPVGIIARGSPNFRSLTNDFFALIGLVIILLAAERYSPTPIAFKRSGIVGTISLEINRESVRGYVNTLCCSYNFCMIFKVSLLNNRRTYLHHVAVQLDHKAPGQMFFWCYGQSPQL